MRFPTVFRALALTLLLALAWGCAPGKAPEPGPMLEPLRQGQAREQARSLDLASQGLGSWLDLAPAVAGSLKYVAGKPQRATALDLPLQDGRRLVLTWGQLAAGLEELLGLLPELNVDPGLLAERFHWFRLRPETLLTGYYEPWIEASLEPRPDYPYPLYGRPPDLRSVDLGRFRDKWRGDTLHYRLGPDGAIEPYPDRGSIDFGQSLAGRGLEVAWAKSLVDVFVLQVQGSGRLLLPDGSSRHVLYAGKNGRDYVALGRVLADRGLLDPQNITMFTIRDVLEAHPELWPELLPENPSYVFFRLSDAGPYGASGARLTPFASGATNLGALPLGAVLALDAALPEYRGRDQSVRGLVLAQDTGAMRPNHMDLFCGSGPRAESLASRMQDTAALHLLVPRSVLSAR